MKKFIVHDNNTLDKLIFTKPENRAGYKEYVKAELAEEMLEACKDALEYIKDVVEIIELPTGKTRKDLQLKLQSIINKAEDK